MEFSRQGYWSGLSFPSPKTDEGGVLHLSSDTQGCVYVCVCVHVCVCVCTDTCVSSYLYLNKLIKFQIKYLLNIEYEPSFVLAVAVADNTMV